MFEYFKKRGLKEEIIKRYNLREDGKNVIIPYYDEDKRFLFNKCRSKDSKKFWYHLKRGSLTLYNFWNLSGYRDYVVITEGEIDCLTLLQFEINAVGSPGAGLFNKSWAEYFSHTQKIYSAYDNDSAGIEGARKLSEETFMSRETYNILIPREGGGKDINDLLLKRGYGKDDFFKLIKTAAKHETTKPGTLKEKKEVKEEVTSGFIEDSKMGEIIYRRGAGSGKFVVYDIITGKYSFEERFEGDTKVYLPDTKDSLVLDSFVRVPPTVEDCGTTRDMISDIHQFLNRYVDIGDDLNRDIVATYILLTYCYDRFSSIPYLRAIGDYGSGKSRLLKVMGIANKSILTSAMSSAAPIFRLIHRFGGTLIIDEAELSRGNERCEDIKDILRFGKDKDGSVPRCEGSSFKVKAFKVFGPKILGARRSYGDDALESRIINIKMHETKAEHIPIVLNHSQFEKEADTLRSKLLMWRLKNFFKIDIEAYIKYIDLDISKRLNEINAPLICIRDGDEEFVRGLLSKARGRNRELTQDKSLSFEANLVKVVERLFGKDRRDPLLKHIVAELSEETGKRYTSRLIGSIIRNNLDLETSSTRDGVAVIFDRARVEELKKEYYIADICD